MSRVIQDSDDELDDDLEADAYRPENEDVTPKQSTSDASSTEALRRQIEAAHRAHLQSQIPVNDTQKSFIHDVHNQKRKLPIGFDSSNASLGNLVPSKSPVTHGREMKNIFNISPADEQQKHASPDQISQPTRTFDGTNWVLEGTMREAYVQHNPNAMFPEPSSTVPNATLTQQRMMEEVLAPALLGSDIDGDGVLFQPDASIPWSEYLRSPTNTGEHPRSSAQEPNVSPTISGATSGPSPYEYPAISKSQLNRQESLALVESLSTQDTSPDLVNVQDIATSLTEEIQPKAAQLKTTLSSTVTDPTRGKPQSSSHGSRRNRPSSGTISDDELADSDLLKEQYKPRPSRSRSLKVGTPQSIDYSVRPETAMKATRRRKSTAATANLANPLHTPDKIRQVSEMGFTPSTSERALKRNHGDVTRAVDWLITNGVADDELVFHTSQMSKTDKDQTTASIEVDRHTDDPQASHVGAKQIMATDMDATPCAVNHSTAFTSTDVVATAVDVKSPAKVQVVIPAKSPKVVPETSSTREMSKKKSKRRKMTLDPLATAATDVAASATMVEKKRGRGRPKKEAKILASTALVEVGDSKEQVRGSSFLSVDGDVQPASVQHQVVEQTVITTAMKPVQGTGMVQPEGAISSIVPSRSTPEPLVLPDRPEVEPITPKKLEKPPRGQPSNNQAKVPYRVGLSKRARIAPLLRTMKK